MSPRPGIPPVARRLCRHFADGELAPCARAGLAALRREHRARIIADNVVGCSIDLDACNKRADDTSNRWDYVLVVRDTDSAVAVEPHPAFADQVDELIAKKAWAAERLASAAPMLTVIKWVWLTGSDEEAGFTPSTNAAHRLAEAKIEFPRVTLRLE